VENEQCQCEEKPVVILPAAEIQQIRKDRDRRYEGHYHITVYYPKNKPISVNDDWFFLLKTLVDCCGLIVETVKFEVKLEASDFALGLREG
jgi:hypothetical protein